jgi:hypothetical protein
MAFCPHCGKSVTDQASKCLACGEEFEPRAKAARFKGTMMMSPGAAGVLPLKPAAPAPSTEPTATPPAAAIAPPAAQPAPRAPTPAPSKVGKHTMLGTGGAGLAPPIGRPSAQQAAMPKAPPPAAAKPAAAPPPPAASAAAEDDMALAATTRQRSEPSGDAATDDAGGEDSQRFLVGDPMAPSPQAAGRSGRRSAQDPTIPGLNAPSAGKLLAIAIGGMLGIAIVGYATARYMGLLN